MMVVFLVLFFIISLVVGEEKFDILHGTETVRISVISNRSLALDSDVFQYSELFKYRWTDKYRVD